MTTQIPLDQVFIVSVWVEALLYGFLLALFLVSLYLNVQLGRYQNVHNKIIFFGCILMFVIATVHVAINCFRLIQGYVILGASPGGSAAYFSELPTWHHIATDILMVTQEILGDALAAYRTFLIWQGNWKVIVLPTLLIIAGSVSGYSVCAFYHTESSSQYVFDPRLRSWILTFFALAFIQSLLSTGLMSYRIWFTDRRTGKYCMEKHSLLPVVRVFIESAALQLVVEVIVFCLYATHANSQYIVLAMITPTVAITFNAITIRTAWQSSEAHSSLNRSSQAHSAFAGDAHQRTIGSIPMQPISISIRKTVEAHEDTRSEAEARLDDK